MAKKKLTVDEVKHVAQLANLPLTDGETVAFEKQLSETIDYIEQLNEVDTKNTSPTYQTGGLTNKLREDETRPSLSQEEALKNTKKSHNGFFVVKAIWD